MYAEDLVTCQGDWEILVPYPGDSCSYTYTHLIAGEQYLSKVFTLHTFMSGGWGGHLGIFWVGICRPGLQIGTPLEKNFP